MTLIVVKAHNSTTLRLEIIESIATYNAGPYTNGVLYRGYHDDSGHT